ncbi:MAG TPA: type I methionyl aminopeptidase [Phycisphaerales bacterium]|nr:type I methionyl aminopeptidase [Phycisphaerales bacterium]HMP36863.1 type I methionyl aminopeptidase [Phycisphaerales bacterium]
MLVTAARDIELAEAAASAVVQVHRRLVDLLRIGMTLPEIDSAVARTLEELGCRSAFLGYRVKGLPPYPSHACLSLNECIVHGTHTMTRRGLERGDLLKVDIGVKRDGFIGDAAWTYAIADADETALALMACGRESLRRGVAAMLPGRPLVDWARAVQGHVERERRFCLVRGLGGHGYGRTLHAAPFISNVEPSYHGEWNEAFRRFEPGMLLAVEPMIALSSTEIRSTRGAWPIFTADGSMSVHYEADVLIGGSGPRNLTEELFELPDIVG